MLFLARFILQGPSQAALVASAMAVLGVVPIVGWISVLISGAAVALVALVQGQQRSMMVMLIALVATALLATLIFTMPWLAMYFALMVWLPVWMTAIVLKRTLSLALSIQLLAALSLLVIVALSLFSEALAGIWQPTLNLLFERVAEQSQGELNVEQMEQVKQLILRMLPGLFAGSLLVGTLLSLFVARWWQALLYHPGGFGEEYRSLNLGRVTALAALLIILIAATARTDMWLAMLVVVTTLYLVQGTAVVHAVVNRRQLNAVWLYLVYALMFLIPHLVLLLVLTGLADAWIDFRRRLAA